MRVMKYFAALSTLSSIAIAQAPTANRSADSAFARGEWASALAAYQELVRKDTVSPSPWLRIGIAQHNLGRYQDAIDAYAKASKRGSSPFATELRFAQAYARLGNKASAFTHLDSAVKVAPVGMLPSVVANDRELASLSGDAHFKTVVQKLTEARYPCLSAPEAQQLNFWVGQWDVAPWNVPPGTPNNVAGTNDVHPMLQNCVIYENWTGAGGGEGKSFNFFEPSTKRWRQVWVADGSGTLDYAGSFRDGAMRFEGKTVTPNGYIMQKLTLTPFGKDTVRQTFEASSDSGKTWNVTFDARYVRHK